MNTLENYLSEYSESHQNITNILIHKFCVPAIMFSVFGLLKALPVPESWPLWLDWSTFAALAALIFYARLKNFKVFFFMFVFILIQIAILEMLRPRFFILCLLIFIVAWIFQFIGHKIEGKKPSFFKDMLFLLIGPIWVIKFLSINNAKEI
jgi:uncharacterized membrane protein YGL010W